LSGTLRPRLVGLFVIGAALLLLAGMLAMSSGGIFTQWRTWAVFLPGAVSGLKEGSPVTMRGVQIGEVQEVQLFFTGRGHEVGVMVVILVRRGSIKTLDGVARVAALSDAEVVRQQVAEGLRAVVKSSSPIAGQKSIELDFHPELNARFSGLQLPYPEVPTAPTGMELLNEKIDETLKKISEMPIDELAAQFKQTLQSAQALLDSGDLHGAISNLRVALASADQTLKRADQTLGGVDKTMDSVNRLVASTQTTVDSANDSMKSAVDNMSRTLATVDRNVERTAETQLEAAQTLDEMRELMKSLRFLVDTLQQHPEALLRGKAEHKEEKK
jgi:paraquat-inducible protein B